VHGFEHAEPGWGGVRDAGAETCCAYYLWERVSAKHKTLGDSDNERTDVQIVVVIPAGSGILGPTEMHLGRLAERWC